MIARCADQRELANLIPRTSEDQGSRSIFPVVCRLAKARSGVAGPLADPQVELHDDKTVIATNDNWGSNATEIEAARVQCGAFA